MSRPWPARVRITEVGPRDGLQNQPQAIPTAAKAAFVRGLVAAGLGDVEVSAFVRPDRVPQLADAAELFARLGPAPAGVTYGALVPNAKGLERALAAGVGKVAVFTAATETFNQRNVGAGTREAIQRFGPVAQGTKAAGLALRGYVSVALGCPYEGPVAPERVLGVVEDLLALGCDEVSVGDTIGVGTPGSLARLLAVLLARVPAPALVLHLHDTRGMAVANVLTGLEHGIAAYDASAGGLGGCPFAPGASGNLATEDLVYLLDGLGVAHGVDLPRLRAATEPLRPFVGTLPGRVRQAPPWPPAATGGA